MIVMRYAAFLAASLLLCACGGGGPGGSGPVTPPLTPSTQTAGSASTDLSAARDTESRKRDVVYVLYRDHVSVYAKSARGSATPVRALTPAGAPLSAIATDRFGNVYVASQDSLTVRKYAATASGNAAPLETFHVADPLPHAHRYQHKILAIGVRYDGGIAALVFRALPNTLLGNLYFGVIDQSSKTLGIVTGIDDFQGDPVFTTGLAVDGSGDVLLLYRSAVDSSAPNLPATVVRRFSPHPDGFHDDGLISNEIQLGSIGGINIAMYQAFAASPENRLELRGTVYPTTTDTSAGTALQLGSLLLPTHAAFDSQDRLYMTIGLLFYRIPPILPATIDIYPRNVTAQTMPAQFTTVDADIPAGIAASP